MPVADRKPIPVFEAVKKLMSKVKTWETETISILNCEDRVLAENIVAAHDVPPFNRSPYDGFAILSSDTEGASEQNPLTLQVIETIGAGHVATKKLVSGQAIRIMTGAKIPDGADAVIMIELIKEKEENGKPHIEIKRQIRKNDNISFQGEDTKKGSLLAEKGTAVSPGLTAVLATFGYAEITVYKKPVVAILSTGTELLDIHQSLQPGKIRNSNAYMVAAQVKAMGAEPKLYQHREDDFDSLFEAVSECLKETDLVITTGGVSVGDFDYLPEIYKRLNAEVLFNKIAMRPGSVTTVAHADGKWLFGLSGNPSACFVGCELFVRPVLYKGMSRKKPHCTLLKAKLGADFPKPNPFTRFVRGVLTQTEEGNIVAPAGLDKSSSISSLLSANSLIVLPGGTRGWEKGSDVGVLTWIGEGSEWPWDSPLFYKSSDIKTAVKQPSSQN